MVHCHILLCLLTEWKHHCVILFLRYLPLDPPGGEKVVYSFIT
jgi:hypothetical protein